MVPAFILEGILLLAKLFLQLDFKWISHQETDRTESVSFSSIETTKQFYELENAVKNDLPDL